MNSHKIACIPGDDIGDNLIAHGWYEDMLLRAIFDGLLRNERDQFLAGVALDVGANIGNHSIWFSKLFARVVAFEPNPICWRILEANLLLNDISTVVLVRSGLSDQNARASFYMNGEGNIGNSGVNADLVKNASTKFEVDLVVGDVALNQDVLGSLPVRLLKIDVEGHEISVLKGLSGVLREHHPIVLFESHGATGATGSDEVVRFLKEHGFGHFYVIERDRPQLASKLLRGIRRAFKGERLIARSVARPEDRPHGLVIASCRNLIATGDQDRKEVTL
ncbi:FkbM family methyltransferase [Luteimonas sp. Sa2BVA3]|uniref:FkbM family methyltransferase n=1 Tax=Luteimonas colneyensis TaxID=2762230 RepID=A0ABR8UJX8_9GAMM|nr:FkbM family methyltransferase [Luteimonas colneyensis]